MNRIERLARCVLDVVGLPGWEVMMCDLDDVEQDAMTALGKYRIYFGRSLEGIHPVLVVSLVLHEAAHALSGCLDETVGFDYQWERLTTQSELARVLDAVTPVIVEEWTPEEWVHTLPQVLEEPEVPSGS